MAVEKKILKNRPFINARGQYNFENGVNIGVDQQGRIDIENDLYTISENNGENQQYTNNPLAENIGLYNGLGNIKINNDDSWIYYTSTNTMQNTDFRVYFIDDVILPEIDALINHNNSGTIFSFNNGGETVNCKTVSGDNNGGLFASFRNLLLSPGYWERVGRIIRWSNEGNSYHCDLSTANTYYTIGLGDNHEGGCYVDSVWGNGWGAGNIDVDNMNITNFPFSDVTLPDYTFQDSDPNPGWYGDLGEEYVDTAPSLGGNYIIDAWSFINHTDATDFNPDGAFYIIYFTEKSDNVNNPVGVFRIPKRDIYNVWISGVERTIVWKSGGDFTGVDYTACYFSGKSGDNAIGDIGLSLTITPPDDYTTGFNNLYDDVYDSYHYTDSDIYLASPYDKKPVTSNSNLLDGPFDFRPITTVDISNLDIQNYYSTKTERLFTSAPNVVNLNFSIAEDTPAFNINYIDDNGDNTWGTDNIKFKAFVVNWDWREGEPENWSQIVNDFPNTEPELILKRTNDNTYNYVDLPNGLSNNYQEYGQKIIKAIVFSYDDNIDGSNNYIPLVWKLLTIKININVDTVYIQDFGDIGGIDYTFIPWPETTPVIGGISEESTYINTLQSVIKQNQFRKDEQLDKILALDAIENDELGDYFGKSDVAQIRYFKSGSYDMNKLLMLDDNLLITSDDENVSRDEFHPYFDYNYWTGDTITTSYPQESCVGTLFINDNMNQELRQNILIELNTNEIDNRTIRDSSGSGFKGVLLGDYAIRKDSKDMDIRKEAEINFSETDSENKAF